MDISYLLFLQGIRESSPALTQIARILTEAAGGSLAMVIVALTYWCLSKELGLQIGFSISLGNLVNQLFKNIFCINRPWIRDSRVIPDEKAVVSATGYSFPSGHSQMGMGIYGTIALHRKNKAWRVCFFLLAALIACSRNFLGVHTPQDVICGLLVGGLGIFLSLRVSRWVSQGENRDFTFAAIVLVIVAAFLLFTSLKSYPMNYSGDTLIVDPNEMIEDCYQSAGMLLGFVFGWLIEHRYVKFTTSVGKLQKLLRALIGIPGMLAVNLCGKALAGLMGNWTGTFLKTILPVLFVIVVWPAIFNLFEKK